MVHSGSRNFGYKVARYFNSRAKQLNEKWSSPVPREFDLAFLPIDSDTAQEYIAWMTLALQFARENRTVMLNVVKRHLLQVIPNIEFQNEVNAHHNYAAAEHHYGKQVWVHRKGAIRARKGETGIIPGAMGTFSYIVKGKGNPESFCSCSHGAGRRMGRQAAKRQFPVAKTIADLKELGVILGKRNKRISQRKQDSLIRISILSSVRVDQSHRSKLKTIAVIKVSNRPSAEAEIMPLQLLTLRCYIRLTAAARGQRYPPISLPPISLFETSVLLLKRRAA